MSAKKNKTPKTPTPDPSASETYAQRRSDIARLLDVLGMELDKHADAAKADPKCWGRVGDLGKVRSDLIDMVGFMSGMERDEVERFLAE
ncbi:MAG: hypothetical protein KF699_10420 [Phycisphaeraceae bacterium]|nr:hypothetical protein [Phycisphaeraceae bacterium]